MEYRVLGPIELVDNDQLVSLGPPKERALLAFLLIHANEVLAIDRIVEALWGEEPPEGAAKTLRVYVAGLRKTLEPGRHAGAQPQVLLTRSPGYVLRIPDSDLDAARFEQLLGRAEALLDDDPERVAARLREALEMWRGRPYEDVAYEPFAQAEIRRLTELRLRATTSMIEAELRVGHHSSVVGRLESLVVEHPFREQLWAQLMLALYRSGRQAEALGAYRRACDALAEELGIEPSSELQALELRILEQDPQLLDIEAPGPADGFGSPSSVMPPQRTSFIGRDQEVTQGWDLLERSRLLTLTGAPGSGKTRLALRLASDHSQDFPHGSFFVPLAAIADPQLTDSTIARVLDLPEVPGETALESLKVFLHDRRVLLILDNFEQVMSTAPRVGELLDAAPDLTIMVTSRVPLGISGEQEFPVPPLRVPPLDEPPDPDSLATYDAVALFVARAQAVDPSFDLNRDNAAAVSEITARLDGLPLAIELAAARIRLLTPRDLLNRLESRLTVLTGGPADAADRHRTMRDAIAWSYDLLEPKEQALFRRLGVFRGFTLEAAAAVADMPDLDVFDGMDSLLSNSLVDRLVDVPEPRYAMLEMLREFALDQLVQAEEEEEAAHRHARFFCALAGAAEPELTGENEAAVVDRLFREVDNIRGALGFACDVPDADLGLVLAGCIWRFWQSSGQLPEGRDWLERLLALPGASDDARAKGLTAVAGLAYWQADYGAAMASYEEALALYRVLEDRFNEADTLYSMSTTASWSGDIDSGERLAEQAHSIFTELGSKEGIGRVLLAQAFAQWKRKDFSGALALYEEGVAIARESGDPVMAVTQLMGVAALTFLLGERDQALRVILATLDEASELRNAHLAVWALDLVAAFLATSTPEQAVRLAGAVDSLRREAGGGMLVESLLLEDARSTAAGLLSAPDLAAAWTEGRAMTLEEAAALAHELGDAVSGEEPAQPE